MTSQVYPARLNNNKKTHPHEAKAVEIIARLKKDGYGFKEIVVDAILRANGCKPEMFDKERQDSDVLDKLDELYKMIAGLHVSPSASLEVQNADQYDDDIDEIGETFMSGFLQRNDLR